MRRLLAGPLRAARRVARGRRAPRRRPLDVRRLTRRREPPARQGNADIVELLNDVLTAELTANNQYFIDAKMLENWGLDRLAEKFREDSIDEMKDADALIDRILYLEVEREAIQRLNRGIGQCTTVADHGTRELLEKILAGEEEHADWLETQLELVRQLGDQHYLSQQVRD